MSYKLECPICRSAASLRVRADPLQVYIHRILPRSFSVEGLTQVLTPKQRGAAIWALAISNCLRRELSLHPRCSACAILMGPGHAEAGIGQFRGTHIGSVASRPMAPSKTVPDSRA
jgi:hypothetical protein